MIFISRSKALDTINQWIQDGSRLESWGEAWDYDYVILRGADGCKEEFYIFNDEESYTKAFHDYPWLVIG